MINSNGLNPDKRSSQFIGGIGLFVVLLCLGLYFALRLPLISFYWISGIMLGYILQRSRFCFTAAFRDPYLTGSTAITRAVLIALGITTMGFTVVKFIAITNGYPIPGQDYIQSIGLSTVVGGLFFGVGMVLASGCASGMLMRIGEGYQIQVIVLIFFFIGSILGNYQFEWWNQNYVIISAGVFLPDCLGWFGALVLQLGVIGVLYVLAIKWEKSHED